MLVVPQRQVLALGCNEEASGTFNTRAIRWSDLENYADWTTTATNNAGEHILDDHGAIVAAEIVGDYVGIWTETSLYLGSYVGDPGQTWNFQKQADVCGPMSTGSVVAHNGTAYWLGADKQFYAWQPGTPPALLACPIQRDMGSNLPMAYRDRTFAGSVSDYGEVWFFYLDGRELAGGTTGGATRYLALNIADGTWFRGQLSRSAMFDGMGLYVPNLRGSALVMAGHSPSATSSIYQHEIIADGVAATWLSGYIQSADQYLDSGRRRMHVMRCVPDFEQQAVDVSLRIYMRDRPQANPVVKGPYTLASGADKVDFRASGMLASVKLSWVGAANVTGNAVQLGKLTFPIVTGGGR